MDKVKYTKKKAEELIEKLRLKHWKILISINNTNPAPPECNPNFTYQYAEIKINKKQLEYYKIQEIQEMITHELLHCLLSFRETDDVKQKLNEDQINTIRLREEQVVSHLSYILTSGKRGKSEKKQLQSKNQVLQKMNVKNLDTQVDVIQDVGTNLKKDDEYGQKERD